VLRDPASLTCRLFTDRELRGAFLDGFKEMREAWLEGVESEFDRVFLAGSGAKGRLAERMIVPVLGRDPALAMTNTPPAVLADKLETGAIYPRELLVRFVLMVEGGLCPAGDLASVRLCERIKEKAAEVIGPVSQEDGARCGELLRMPAHVALSEARWPDALPLVVADFHEALLRRPFRSVHLELIGRLPGAEALRCAASGTERR